MPPQLVQSRQDGKGRGAPARASLGGFRLSLQLCARYRRNWIRHPSGFSSDDDLFSFPFPFAALPSLSASALRVAQYLSSESHVRRLRHQTTTAHAAVALAAAACAAFEFESSGHAWERSPIQEGRDGVWNDTGRLQLLHLLTRSSSPIYCCVLREFH